MALAVLVFGPVLILFGIEDFLAGRAMEAYSVFLTSTILFSSLLITRKAGDIRWGYRFVSMAVVGILAFQLVIGGGSGLAFLWFYFFPVWVFYLLGAREGILWVAASMTISSTFLLLDLGYSYPPESALRFSFSYILVGVMALGLETGRARLENRLREEKEQLEVALSEVTVLSGMLPICASCKRIRDDEGYWTRIESYLSERSAAVFTHGLCPPCSDNLFPGLFDDEGPDESERDHSDEEGSTTQP